MPVHNVFLELIIDPAVSTAFEAEHEKSDAMDSPPHAPRIPLFNRRTNLLSLFQGLGVLWVVLFVFSNALFRGQGEFHARALTFTTLIVANLSLLWTNCSWTRTILEMLCSPNKVVWWVTGGAAAFLALVLWGPFLRNLFRFPALHSTDIAICIDAGMERGPTRK